MTSGGRGDAHQGKLRLPVRALVTLRRAEEGEAKRGFAEARARAERAVESLARLRRAAKAAEARQHGAETEARRMVDRPFDQAKPATAGGVAAAQAWAEARGAAATAARDRVTEAAGELELARHALEEARHALEGALRRREAAEREEARAKRATDRGRARREQAAVDDLARRRR